MVRGKHRLVHLLAPRLPKPPEPAETYLIDGAKIGIHKGPGWGLDFWYIRVHEPDVTPVFMKLLRRLEPGRSVVDLGANIGYFTLLAARELRDGKVFAFEPHPRALKELRANVDLNHFDNVVIEAAAVGDEQGSGDLHASDIDLGWSSMLKVQDELEPVARVEMVTLDDYFADRDERIGLIKADIQGAETDAILGGAKTIERDKPAMIIEEWPHGMEQFGYSVTDLKKILAQMGYKVFKIQIGRLRWSVVTPAPPTGKDCGDDEGSYTNLLCLPDD